MMLFKDFFWVTLSRGGDYDLESLQKSLTALCYLDAYEGCEIRGSGGDFPWGRPILRLRPDWPFSTPEGILHTLWRKEEHRHAIKCIIQYKEDLRLNDLLMLHGWGHLSIKMFSAYKKGPIPEVSWPGVVRWWETYTDLCLKEERGSIRPDEAVELKWMLDEYAS